MTSTSSSVTGRLTFAGFPIVWSARPLGSSMTASRITRRSSTAMRTLRSSRSTNPEKHLHIKGQTLRLYNPDSHQWSIYTLDLDKGALNLPPVVGQFTGNRGEFYDQELYKGRSILVRYVWLNISPKSARMEQFFSPNGEKTWETNWICELTR